MYNNIAEVKTALATWREERLTSIVPTEGHCVFKLSFEVEYLREALSYRFAELTEAAVFLVESTNLLGAVVVARSAQETLAALFYLNELVQKSIERKEVANLCEKSKRLMFGKGKKEEPFPDKISVITLVQKVDKLISGYEKHYDSLSDYSHPNWSGTMGLFAKTGGEEIKVDFHRYIRGEESIRAELNTSITTNASLFEYVRSEYDKISQGLIDLCEELHKRGELLPQISPEAGQNK